MDWKPKAEIANVHSSFKKRFYIKKKRKRYISGIRFIDTGELIVNKGW